MRSALQRLRFEFLAPVALSLTVFVVACGSSSPAAVHRHAGSLRWVALGILLVVAAGYALSREDVPRIPIVAGTIVAWLGCLALVSTVWSVQSRITVERAVSFGVVLAVAGLLAYASAGRVRERQRLLIALAVGAAIIAVAGVVVLAVNSSDAIVWWRSGTAPTRYQGFGENPNTVGLLASLAAPAAAWVAVEARTLRGRVAGAVLFVLVFGSVVASQSRGAGLSAAGGLVLLVLLLPRPWRVRAALLAGAGAAIVLTVFVSSLRYTGDTTIALPSGGSAVGAETQRPAPTGTQRPAPTGTQRPAPTGTQRPPPTATQKPAVDPSPATAPERPIASYSPSREGEIGNPFFTGETGSLGAYTSSGRTAAWRGALHLAAERPLLGYGFGTEDRVFVDRYYLFQGARPENAFIGWLLQLGAVGLAAFLLLGLALLVTVGRAVRRAPAPERSVAVGLAAVAFAGYLAAINQSYVYAAGNIAMLTFWVAVLALAATREGARIKGAPDA